MQSLQAHGIIAKHALTAAGWRENVWIRVAEDGSISHVSGVNTAQDLSAAVAVDLLLPGVVNLHSHAFQRDMAGLTEVASGKGDNFWSWRQVMYQYLATLQPEDVYRIARQLYADMLKAGYTSVAEFHYLHHDVMGEAYSNASEMSLQIIQAARDTGIALTLLPVLYGYSNFGGKLPESGQRRFVHRVDSYLKLLGDLNSYVDKDNIVIGVAFHSLRAVTPEMITDVMAALPALGMGACPVHIHIAEQQKEVEACLAWSGQRPVAWLLDHVDVDGRWCLVHATHMDAEETTRLAVSGAVAGLCPTTEANLGDGIFPAREYGADRGKWGIGSDSHVSVSPWEELRLLEYGQRLHYRERCVLSDEGKSVGRSLFDGAVLGGAAASGRKSGAIAEGYKADLQGFIFSDGSLLSRRHGDSMLDTLVFATPEVWPSYVWVNGRQVVCPE